MITTGELIRDARKKANLTQKELAQKMGVVQTVVSEYETGKRKPKFSTLHKIADALGCPELYLIGEDDKNDSYLRGLKQYYDIPDPTPEEIRQDKLENAFYDLNETGQQKLVDYAEDLTEIPKYKK